MVVSCKHWTVLLHTSFFIIGIEIFLNDYLLRIQMAYICFDNKHLSTTKTNNIVNVDVDNLLIIYGSFIICIEAYSIAMTKLI